MSLNNTLAFLSKKYNIDNEFINDLKKIDLSIYSGNKLEDVVFFMWKGWQLKTNPESITIDIIPVHPDDIKIGDRLYVRQDNQLDKYPLIDYGFSVGDEVLIIGENSDTEIKTYNVQLIRDTRKQISLSLEELGKKNH